MMAVIENGDIVEVRFNYVQNQQRLMNVMHYRATEVTPGLDYEAAMSYALDKLETELSLWPITWATGAVDTASIYKITAQKIFPTRLYHMDKLLDIQGYTDSEINPPLPQNVQLSLTKVSEEAGRGRTGRVEVPGGNVNQIEDGRLSDLGVLWMENLALAIQQNVNLEDLQPSTLTPVILYGFAPAGSPDLTLVRIQDTVRVTRRRTVGVGE